MEGETRDVAIVVDPADAVASSPPARWAAGELERALTERGVSARIFENAAQAPVHHLRIAAARNGFTDRRGGESQAAGAHADVVPEALALCQGKRGVWACGYDARGLTYALLELADRVATPRPAGRFARSAAGDRASGECRPQRHEAVHQRC